MRRQNGRLSPILLGGPYILILILFLAVPLLNLGTLSVFTHQTNVIWSPHLTLANYRSIFADDFYVGLIGSTLGIAVISTAVAAVIGYPIAYYLARCPRRVLPVGLFFLMMPLMVSAVVRAYGWTIVFSRAGLLNEILGMLDLPGVTVLMNSQWAVCGSLVQFVLPVMALSFMASIERIPVSLEEAAANLGCHHLAVFWGVTLPLSMSGLVSGCILGFTLSASAVVIPALIGGRHGRMFGNEIYDQVVSSFNWPLASALAVILVLVTLVLVAVALVFDRRST